MPSYGDKNVWKSQAVALAARLADNEDSISELPRQGLTGCWLFRLSYRNEKAIFKVAHETYSDSDSVGTEIERNLSGYQTMPSSLRPAIFATERSEKLHWLLMEDAGLCVRHLLASTAVDPKLWDLFESKLTDGYLSIAVESPADVLMTLKEMFSSEENVFGFTRQLMAIRERLKTDLFGLVSPDDIDEMSTLVSEIRMALEQDGFRKECLPRFASYTTRDFTIDNLFVKEDKLLLIDPKASTLGPFELDLGMCHILPSLYTHRYLDSGEIVSVTAASQMGQLMRRVVWSIRSRLEPDYDPEPMFLLGQSWQEILSARFRAGSQSRQLLRASAADLTRVRDSLLL